jgi:nucleoside-triphosphatase THEP1
MAKTKFEKQYEEMMKNYKDVFDELKEKSSNPKTEEFKALQLKVMRIIRKNEDNLCSKMENTHYSNYSVNLAEKFWELIRIDYPEVDISID